MTTMRVLSLRHLSDLTEQTWQYPFYAALLYAPINGLHARLHGYVTSHWGLLNRLTGDNCLMLAVEDIEQGPPVEKFKPEEVYDIARYFGADIASLPCMVVFTDPQSRKDTLVLRLSEFLGPPADLTDEGLTDFFQSLASIMDKCVADAEHKLDSFRTGLNQEWPEESTWSQAAHQVSGWAVPSITTAGTLAVAALNVMKLIRMVGGAG